MTVENGKYKPSLSLSLEDKIELSIELARIALECPTCKGLFKQAIENRETVIAVKMNANEYHLKEGGPLIGSSRSKEEVCNIDNSRS